MAPHLPPPAAPRIDSHQHFWRYQPEHFGWIDDRMAVLRRDFLPGDLQPLLAAAGMTGCIAVQAQQTLAENRFLLECADAQPLVRGVVGWVDLQSPAVSAQLREFAADPRCCGVRHVAQAEPDPRFLVSPAFTAGIAAMAPFDLVYDLLVFPHQLPAAIELCARFPAQRFVLDHLAKPGIAGGAQRPWADDLRRLAALPNVSCKLSGMVTEADWRAWSVATLRPWFDAAYAAFGSDRLLFGSDWPVCLCASSYACWVDTVESLLAPLGQTQRAAIFGANAARIYRLR